MATERPHGFDFDLCNRNAWLEKQGLKQLKPWSTGTTIAGVVFKVRAEEKNRSRDHEIAPKRSARTAGEEGAGGGRFLP